MNEDYDDWPAREPVEMDDRTQTAESIEMIARSIVSHPEWDEQDRLLDILGLALFRLADLNSQRHWVLASPVDTELLALVLKMISEYTP